MTEWINTKDKLPTEDGKYLCCRSNKYIDIYSFTQNLRKVDKYDFANKNRKGWYDYDSEWGYCEIDEITHWMPLPELPKMDGGKAE